MTEIQPAPHPPNTPRNARNGAVKGAAILLVEDDADIRQMTTTVLQNAGARVTTVASAEEALDYVSRDHFDAIVLDWHLEDMTGSGLLTSLRQTNPDLFNHSTVVTGDLMSVPGKHEAERFGRPVLAKPFRPSLLIQTLNEMLS